MRSMINKFEAARIKFRDSFSKGIKPVDGRQPIPDDLAIQMISELNLPKDAVIGVIDAFLILSTHLKEAGYTNIVVLENIHSGLTDAQEMYYDKVKKLCASSGITYYVPPMNNYNRCDMKFDAIIGNPPYQDGKKDTSYNQLWAEFFVKGFNLLKDDGIQVLIHPVTWATPKDNNRRNITNEVVDILKNHATFINYMECGKYFPKVGSTFSYTVVTKAQNNGVMKVVTDVDEFTVDTPSNFIDNVLSKDNDKNAISIINKIRNYGSREVIKKGKSLVGDLSKVKDNTHIYRVQYAATTEKWSDVQHPLQDMKKVLFANQSSKNYPVYDDGISAPCNRGAIYEVSSADEGNNIVETMKTDVMNFFFSRLRFHHGLLNTNVINSIPNLDYSRVWTNDELMSEFSLTSEEQIYLNSKI